MPNEGFNMKDFLASQRENFNAGAEKRNEGGKEFEKLSDGKYSAKLAGMEFGVSKAGRPQLIWRWLITAGAKTGFIHYVFQGLDKGEDSWKYVAKDLEKLGYDPAAMPLPEEFETDVFPELLRRAPLVRLSLKTKTGGNYQGTYIDKVAQEGEDFSDEEAMDEINGDADFGTSDNYDPMADEGSGLGAAQESDASVAEEQEEESVDLQVGMKVRFERSGEQKEGEVKEIDESDPENIEVKVRVGGKTYTVPISDLQVVAETV